MHRILITAGMLISFGLFSGCASIVNGQNQSISIDTPGCSPANCKLTNDKGTWFVTTPDSVTVRRAFVEPERVGLGDGDCAAGG